MAPTPGNHDWPDHESGYDSYWQRVTGAPTPPWYAFRAGGWHVLVLNSEAPHGPGSAQLRWLRAQLRGRTSCRLANWHRPRFSAGRHGDQPDMSPMWDALRGHAALVLSGHDHTTMICSACVPATDSRSSSSAPAGTVTTGSIVATAASSSATTGTTACCACG
jgi:calcineurin-like phosphoesterase family protein